jgi:hypothetical protein
MCIFKESFLLDVGTNADSVSVEVLANQDGLSIGFPVNSDFKNGKPPVLSAVIGVLLVLMQIDHFRADFPQLEGLTVVDVQEGGYGGAVAHGSHYPL